MRKQIRNLLLIVVCAVLSFGGSFECHYGHDDDDDEHHFSGSGSAP